MKDHAQGSSPSQEPSGTIRPSGQLGTAHVGSTPDGSQFVHQQHVQGGSSANTLDPDGTFHLTVTHGYPLARAGEREVAQTLVAYLVQHSSDARLLGGAEDGRGEDGLLLVGGQRMGLQVVTGIKAQQYLRAVHKKGSEDTQGSLAEFAHLLGEAIQSKASQYGRLEAERMVLALDVRFAPLLSNQTTVAAYNDCWGTSGPAEAFAAVYIVGHAPEFVTPLWMAPGLLNSGR